MGWGCDIANACSSPSIGLPKPNILKNELFRLAFTLDLNPDFHIRLTAPLPLPPGKSAVELVADYLNKMLESLWDQLPVNHNHFIPNFLADVDYCFAVSPSWESGAKSAMMSAITDRGMIKLNGGRPHLISDAHAAASYCFSTNLIEKEKGAVVLVIDCGGRMTQLIALRLEDAESLEFSECTAPSSETCGSHAVDENFTNLIREKVRKMRLSVDDKLPGKLYWRTRLDFQNRIKANFTNSGQDWRIHIGPGSDCAEVGFMDEYITITNKEIFRCFDPVVNCIIDLMNIQVNDIKAQKLKLEVFVAREIELLQEVSAETS